MQIPNNCPVCNSELKKKLFLANISGKIISECDSKNHKFKISFTSEDEIISILYYRNNGIIIWNFKNNKLNVSTKIFGPIFTLPFFEPNFSNIPRLENKIKTYLTFL